MSQTTKKSRKEYRHLDGILLLDKPKGVSSNFILQRIKHLFEAKKAGHSGTLDPMATGLLPICFGEATKFSGQLLNNHKTYQFTCLLGQKTESGDADGAIIEEADIPAITAQLLTDKLKLFVGPIKQVPPMVSALHHNGERLYNLARQGIEVERPARIIEIRSLKLINYTDNQFSAEVTCSKGTYVRVLAEDIANTLGTVGHLITLRRTNIDPFIDPIMITYDQLEPLKEDLSALDQFLVPMDSAVSDLPKWIFSHEEGERIKQGQRISVTQKITENEYRLYTESGEFLGIGTAHAAQSMGAKRLIKTN